METNDARNTQNAKSNDRQGLRDAANSSVKEPKAKRKKPLGLKEEPAEPVPMPGLSPAAEDQWRLKVSEAAYYRAERRGFAPGYSIDDWLVAEAEVKGTHGAPD
jgi:hypothetical protein